jgi:hypothetical protein
MMNDLPIWPIVITGSLIVGGYFALRNKTCSAIFYRIVAGVCLMALGGLLFLYPGLKMMGAFAETERKAGAQVVFTDTPIFLGSPEAWVLVGLVMIVAGGYLIYSFFKRPATK